MNMNFDVIVITKNRYKLLLNQIKRIKDIFPYNKIIVIDSNENIPEDIKEYYLNENIEFYHTPNVNIGNARQTGLKNVTTKYFFMIDDDIVFKKYVAYEMYYKMINYTNNVFALSPIILFGTNENILSIYKRKRKDVEGVSSGYCIINKDIINKIGGFNVNIHVGEDSELFYRAKKKGYNWMRLHNVFVNHPCTDMQFIFRTWNHRKGMMFSVNYGFDTYYSLILKKLRDMFLNLISFIKHRNYRTTMFLICNDFISLITYVWGMINV